MALFGRQEDVMCLVNVDIVGDVPEPWAQAREPLCLAYKTSTYFFGLGVYIRDDGYVLGPRELYTHRYYPLSEDEIRQHQGDGTLPSPLPAYAIKWTSYAWGYSLWIAVAISVGWHFARKRLAPWRRERAT